MSLQQPISVVLDTNVALALIVFGDRSLASLARAWCDGEVRAIVDDATLGEFDRVVAYDTIRLDATRVAAARAEYRRRATGAGRVEHGARCRSAGSLPRCSDGDDQKFLELAARVSAQWLLTRDKALLKLARARHGMPFRIALPERLDVLLAGGGCDPRSAVGASAIVGAGS